MGVIFLTLFICVYIGVVCWTLGFIQRVVQKKFQKSNSKYQRLKTEMRKSMSNKE